MPRVYIPGRGCGVDGSPVHETILAMRLQSLAWEVEHHLRTRADAETEADRLLNAAGYPRGKDPAKGGKKLWTGPRNTQYATDLKPKKADARGQIAECSGKDHL